MDDVCANLESQHPAYKCGKTGKGCVAVYWKLDNHGKIDWYYNSGVAGRCPAYIPKQEAKPPKIEKIQI